MGRNLRLPWKMESNSCSREVADEQYETFPEIKLVCRGIHLKKFRATSNLDGVNTRIVFMTSLTPRTEM